MFGRRGKSSGRPTPEGNPGASGPSPAAASFGHDPLPADDAELMRDLRSRLLEELPESPAGVSFEYSRPLGPFTEVLSRDLPYSVATLSDQGLADRDVELFFAAARRNTELEPSRLEKLRTKSGVDLWLLEGDGFFVSSQLPWLAKRIADESGAAEVGEGLLTVAPRRGSLLSVCVNDDQVLKAVPLLLDGLRRFSDPSGFSGLYFIRDPAVAGEPGGENGFSDGPLVQNVLGGRNVSGVPAILVDGPFADALRRVGVELHPDGEGGPGGGASPTDGPSGPDGPGGL